MIKALWTPGQDRADRANLSRFMRFVREEGGSADMNSYAPLYRFSVEQPARFWTVLWDFIGIRGSGEREPVVSADEGMASARWFPGVRLNFAHNLLRFDDDRASIRSFGNDGERDVLSHAQLERRVAAVSAAMRATGITAADRVAASLLHGPEAIVAMLAAASIGATWFTCPASMPREELAAILAQLQPRLLFAETASDLAGFEPVLARGAMAVVMRGQVPDDAPAVSLLSFVANHGDAPVEFTPLPFDHPLYITVAASRGHERELVMHGAGGTLIQHLKELVLHADLKREDRVFFHADNDAMSWYWLASCLSSGATLVLHDDSELPADGEALWDLVDSAGVTVLGVHSTWLDACARSGRIPRESHRLLSLKTILTAGSPLSAEGYEFVYRDVKDRVFLAPVATGTDTLGCLAIGAPVLPLSSGEIPCRALGVALQVLDADGQAVVDTEGDMAVCAPFPSMPLGFWNDQDGSRFLAHYFSRQPGVWCLGERAVLTSQDALVI